MDLLAALAAVPFLALLGMMAFSLLGLVRANLALKARVRAAGASLGSAVVPAMWSPEAPRLVGRAAEAADAGDYTAAFELLAQARAAYRANGGARVDAYLAMVDAREAHYRYDYGDYAGALAAMRLAATGLEDGEGDNGRTAVRGSRLCNEASYLHMLGRDAEALTAAEEAVALLRTAAGDSPGLYAVSLAAALSTVALAQLGLGRPDDAATTAAQAVELARSAQIGAAHLAQFLRTQALVLARTDPPAAVETAAAAAEITRAVIDTPTSMGAMVAVLAMCLAAAGDHDRTLRASGLGEHLLRPFTDTPSPRRHLARTLAAKTTALAALGRHDDARTCANEALAMLGTDRGEPWNRVAVTTLEAAL